MSAKQLWWQEYRKRVNRPNIRNLSKEFICRHVFKTTAKEYASNCSISGLQHVFSSKVRLMERIIWLIVVSVMVCSIFLFLKSMWIDNLAMPFIVSMESSSYPISQIDFPAIAICNFNRISKKALEEFVTESYDKIATRNESLDEVMQFMRQLGRLVDHTYNPLLDTNPLFFSFAKYLGDTRNITKLMFRLAPSCRDLLLVCMWSGELVDCNSIFAVRRTVNGHCCAFNYVLDYDSAGRPNSTISEKKRQKNPGQYEGLNVILNPMLEDYEYSISNMMGFQVLIYDPTHFADPMGGRIIQRIIQPRESVLFQMKSTKQTATQEFRKYSTTSRKCLFHDDVKEVFNNMYSYSACIVKCRIKTVQALCKCTPFYLPVSREDGPVCTLDNLKCLNKYKEKLFYLYPLDTTNTAGLETEVQNALYCPECLPDCELTQHSTKHSKVPIYIKKHRNKQLGNIFIASLNNSDVCLLSVYQATTDAVLNRLDVVYYWFEILSNIGGFCGMLMGFSIISVLEFVYIFIIGLIINIIKVYYRNNNGIY